jgi:hypothetical protein
MFAQLIIKILLSLFITSASNVQKERKEEVMIYSAQKLVRQ